MKKISLTLRTIYFTAISCLLFSCADQVDFSNPNSVVEYYYSLRDDNEFELQYELLADTCKEFVTLQDYLNFYLDENFGKYTYKTQNIVMLPFDSKNPKYRHFEIQRMYIGEDNQDTIKNSFSYLTVLNENGQWRVIWTGIISKAGNEFSNDGKSFDAIEAYDEVLRYDPLNGSAHRRLGWCRYKENRIGDALNNAKKAVALNPKDPFNYNLLAAIYSQQDKEELAIMSAKKAIDMTNSDLEKSVLLSNLSTSYGEMENFDEEEKAINLALKYDSTNTHAFWRKALYTYSSGKIDSAITYFQKAVALEPMDISLQFQLYEDFARLEYGYAIRQLESGDKEKRDKLLIDAKKNYLKAFELRPDNDYLKEKIDIINDKIGTD